MKNSLEAEALWVRQRLWEMTVRAKRGHLPSCFSCVDILVALYFSGGICIDPKAPKNPNRDRVIISKGHAGAVLYPILAKLGFFPMEELDRYAQPDGLLGMYANPSIPGIEAISDSLGHGLGIGCGFALAGKKDGLKYKTYVILGDAECNEGSVWESAAFASHYGLDNLVAIVDYNKLGILGEPVCLGNLGAPPIGQYWPNNSLHERWLSFGWHIYVADGHDFFSLAQALQAPGQAKGQPYVIIANTVKGKGVSFMENKPEWHNKVPVEDFDRRGRQELGLL